MATRALNDHCCRPGSAAMGIDDTANRVTFSFAFKSYSTLTVSKHF